MYNYNCYLSSYYNYYSPWVKFRFLEDVGHFPHLEAPQQVIETLTELLSVPVTNHII